MHIIMNQFSKLSDTHVRAMIVAVVVYLRAVTSEIINSFGNVSLNAVDGICSDDGATLMRKRKQNITSHHMNLRDIL